MPQLNKHLYTNAVRSWASWPAAAAGAGAGKRLLELPVRINCLLFMVLDDPLILFTSDLKEWV